MRVDSNRLAGESNGVAYLAGPGEGRCVLLVDGVGDVLEVMLLDGSFTTGTAVGSPLLESQSTVQCGRIEGAASLSPDIS